MRNRPHLTGKAELAKARHGSLTVSWDCSFRSRSHGDGNCKVSSWLINANPTNDIQKHVSGPESEPTVSRQDRKDQCEAVSVNPVGNAPGLRQL